jgi:hypothetical protein
VDLVLHSDWDEPIRGNAPAEICFKIKTSRANRPEFPQSIHDSNWNIEELLD